MSCYCSLFLFPWTLQRARESSLEERTYLRTTRYVERAISILRIDCSCVTFLTSGKCVPSFIFANTDFLETLFKTIMKFLQINFHQFWRNIFPLLKKKKNNWFKNSKKKKMLRLSIYFWTAVMAKKYCHYLNRNFGIKCTVFQYYQIYNKS